MNGVSLLLAVASLNVVYSWRTGIDQQKEYVLQIEPEIVQALVAGEEIFSDVPPDAGSFQRICITILPKDSPITKHTAAGEEQFRQLLLSAGRLASRDRALVAPDAPPTILWPGRPGSSPEQSYGVATGWQPDSAGNQQYIVQLDPTVLSTLSVGDELYVPVEPAAGRITRFIVKAGRETPPRIGGPAQYAQSPTGPLSSAAGRSRFPGGSTTGASTWGNTTVNDPQRPPSQWSGGYAEATSDPRANRFQSPPTSPPHSRGVGFEQPPPAFADSLAPRTGGAAFAPATDAYGRSLDPSYRNPPVSDLATYPGYNPAAAGQQPQLPGQRPFGAQYPDARMAGLPPTSLNTTGAGVPGISSANALAPNQDRPWGPLLFVTFALFFSIGGNLYLAYTALEFHSRYRSAIERLRSAARSA